MYVKAALSNQLEILKWIQHIKPHNMSSDIFYTIASRGHVEMVNHLYLTGIHFESKTLCNAAARYDRFEILQWAFENNIDVTSEVYITAAHAGCINVIMWAHNLGLDWDKKQIPIIAAQNNHIEIVKWCIKHDAILDLDILHEAAVRNHTDIVDLLIDHGVMKKHILSFN